MAFPQAKLHVQGPVGWDAVVVGTTGTSTINSNRDDPGTAEAAIFQEGGGTPPNTPRARIHTRGVGIIEAAIFQEGGGMAPVTPSARVHTRGITSTMYSRPVTLVSNPGNPLYPWFSVPVGSTTIPEVLADQSDLTYCTQNNAAVPSSHFVVSLDSLFGKSGTIIIKTRAMRTTGYSTGVGINYVFKNQAGSNIGTYTHPLVDPPAQTGVIYEQQRILSAAEAAPIFSATSLSVDIACSSQASSLYPINLYCFELSILQTTEAAIFQAGG